VPKAEFFMYTLCHHIKDDRKICNCPAMRGKKYCYHRLDLYRREARIARARRRNLQAIVRKDSLNDLAAVETAIQRLRHEIPNGRVEKQVAELVISALRLSARNLRYSPEDMAGFPSLRPKGSSTADLRPEANVPTAGA
jgi:hypothetical protein